MEAPSRPMRAALQMVSQAKRPPPSLDATGTVDQSTTDQARDQQANTHHDQQPQLDVTAAMKSAAAPGRHAEETEVGGQGGPSPARQLRRGNGGHFIPLRRRQPGRLATSASDGRSIAADNRIIRCASSPRRSRKTNSMLSAALSMYVAPLRSTMTPTQLGIRLPFDQSSTSTLFWSSQPPPTMCPS